MFAITGDIIHKVQSWEIGKNNITQSNIYQFYKPLELSNVCHISESVQATNQLKLEYQMMQILHAESGITGRTYYHRFWWFHIQFCRFCRELHEFLCHWQHENVNRYSRYSPQFYMRDNFGDFISALLNTFIELIRKRVVSNKKDFGPLIRALPYKAGSNFWQVCLPCKCIARPSDASWWK